jgi:hypothetical protein
MSRLITWAYAPIERFFAGKEGVVWERTRTAVDFVLGTIACVIVFGSILLATGLIELIWPGGGYA